jgi:hypothetical protein
VSELIGDQFRIDTGLTGQTRMRPAQDLKGRPLESDGFQLWSKTPPAGIHHPEDFGEELR